MVARNSSRWCRRPAVLAFHLQAALTAAGPPAVAPLSALLRSKHAGTRDAAVAALQAMIREHYGSLKAVVALSGTEDVPVRCAAVRVLSGQTFWERRAVGALVQTLSDQEKAVRAEAIRALSAVSEWSDQVTNALPALRAFVASVSGDEHEAAAAAVRRIEATQRLP
jgi:HEAT repeat protein